MVQTTIRFGIIGCAHIAAKVARGITLAPNATLYAVGSRSLEKATKFAAENGFPPNAKIYGSYEAVLDDPDVDAVYIPIPTSMHVQWAVLAAQKKKHVLLEKPVALNAAEFDKIIESCEANGVQLMDGTQWIHFPRTAEMGKFLSDDDHFGQLKSIHTCITYDVGPDFLKNDIRTKPDLDALGVLGDAGWYGVNAGLWATNYELPEKVVALHGPVLNEAGVILACGASLHWKDGRIATFYCSFLSNFTLDITAVGTKGTLRSHDFIVPCNEIEASFSSASGWFVKPSVHTINTDIPQEAFMVKEFSRLVQEIKFNSAKPDKKWPIMSRKTQMILDAVKTSIERDFQPIQIED